MLAKDVKDKRCTWTPADVLLRMTTKSIDKIEDTITAIDIFVTNFIFLIKLRKAFILLASVKDCPPSSTCLPSSFKLSFLLTTKAVVRVKTETPTDSNAVAIVMQRDRNSL